MQDLIDPGVLTDGLVELRPWVDDDLPAVCAGQHLDEPEALAWIRRQQVRPLSVGVSRAIAPLDQAAVGYVGLIRRPRVELGVIRAGADGELVVNAHQSIVGIGYWVTPDSRGAGLATRAVGLISRGALQRARITRVEALLDPENTPSRRVVEKCGFSPEGRLRGYLELPTGSGDALAYSLLASDLPRTAPA